MKWNGHPILARRPHAPNKGRGRLQRQVRRALLVHGPLVTTSQLSGLGLSAYSTAPGLGSLEGQADLLSIVIGSSAARAG